MIQIGKSPTGQDRMQQRTHNDDTGRGGGQSKLGVDFTGKGDDAFTNDHGLGGELTTAREERNNKKSKK